MVVDLVFEGIFFYSIFVFFYNLVCDQKMMVISQMIFYIQCDENQYCYFFVEVFKQLFVDFFELNIFENMDYIYKIIDCVVELEINWVYYIFSNVCGIDLNELEDYIKYIVNKCLCFMGMDKVYEGVDVNCMFWIKFFFDEVFNVIKIDFFEVKFCNYGKVGDDNGFDDL